MVLRDWQACSTRPRFAQSQRDRSPFAGFRDELPDLAGLERRKLQSES
jgi:hypothetical protein